MKSTTFALIEVFNDRDSGFRGNTSAVIYLSEPLNEKLMQEIASDFNQPATTFLFPADADDKFNVRWFAPDAEIGLCGHGSLAAMVFLDKYLDKKKYTLSYNAGEISGTIEGENWYSIKLKPIPVVKDLDIPPSLEKGLGQNIDGYYGTDNKYIVLLENENAVRKMKPDFAALKKLDVFGYAVTAPGSNCDFVSRTLVPHVQQLEDPATGSSHAALAPFWAQRLRKSEMTARQLSSRGGYFRCKLDGRYVILYGKGELLAEGFLDKAIQDL